MQWYLASLGMLLVLAMLGFLTGALVIAPLPARMQPVAREFLCLPLGWAVLVLLVTALGWVGSGFQRGHVAWWVVACAAAGAWVGRDWLWRRDGRWVRLAVFCGFGSFSVLAPLWFIGAFSAYNDTYIYITHAQWLQTHGALAHASTAHGHIAWAQAVWMQNAKLRLGTSFLLAAVQAGFGREWSYEVFPLTAALGVVCGALGVGATVLAACPGRWAEAWLAALAAAGTMNGFVFGATSGFFAQTWGLAFAATAGGLRALEVGTRAEGSGAAPWRTGVPLGVCVAAAMQCYWDLLPLLGPALAATYLLPWPGRDREAWRRVWSRVWVPGLTCVVLVNAEFLHAIPGVFGNARAVVANPVRWRVWDFPAHALGLKASVWQRGVWITRTSHRYSLALGCVGAVVFSGLMALTWRKAEGRRQKAEGRRQKVEDDSGLLIRRRLLACFAGQKTKWRGRALVFALVWVALTATLFVYFRYVVASPWREENPTGWPDGVGQSWSQYKLTIWSSVVCVGLVVALGTAWVARREGWGAGWWRGAWVLVLVLWGGTGLGWHAVAAWHGNQMLVDTGLSRDPFAACLEIRRRVATLPQGASIYLDWPVGEKVKLREMMVYFLYDHPLVSDWDNDGSLGPFVAPEEAGRTAADCAWVLRYRPPEVGRAEGERAGAVGGMTLEKGGR